MNKGYNVDITYQTHHKTDSKHCEDERDENENSDNIDLYTSSDKLYIGKGSISKRCKVKANLNVLTRSWNIGGKMSEGKNVTNEIEAIIYFFISENILEPISEYTSIYIESTKHIFQWESDASSIDILELQAFFDLLYFIGSQPISWKNLSGTLLQTNNFETILIIME